MPEVRHRLLLGHGVTKPARDKGADLLESNLHNYDKESH